MGGEFHLTKPNNKPIWFANLLNVIFPGVGLIYWRRDTGGILWLSLSLSVSIGLICLWMLVPFLPQLLGSLLILYWLIAQWYLFEQVRAEPATQTVWSRSEPQRSSYVGLGCLCVSLILLTLYIAMTRVYSFVQVQDMSMYPSIFEGDVLLVDRRLYEGREFEIGEIIAYESLSSGVRISRVLASSVRTKRIEVIGAQVQLDQQLLDLKPVDMTIAHLEDERDLPFAYQQFYLEYAPQWSVAQTEPASPLGSFTTHVKNWIVSEPIDKTQGNMSLKGHLGKNTLLVMPDVRKYRTSQLNTRGEIIDSSRVIGRPLMVVQSRYDHPQAHLRRGLRIR